MAESSEQTPIANRTTSSGPLPERHRSLWAVCDHSWALLSPAEQTVYRRLAIFRGGFSNVVSSEA